MTGQPEAITPDELRASIDRLGWYMQRGADGEPATHPADRIIRDVERNREPEYEPGTAYQDSRGDVYLRSTIGDWVDRSGTRHGHTFPGRPLTRLVPEGSPLADSERDLIRADLGKLLDLLGLGDFARPASSHEVFLMCLEAVRKMAGDTGGTCPGGC